MSYFGGNENSSDEDEKLIIDDDDDDDDYDESIKGEEIEDEDVVDEGMEEGNGEDEDIEDDDEDNDEDRGEDGGEGDDTEYADEDPNEEDDDDDDENADKQKKTKKIPTKNVYKKPPDYINDDDDDANGEQYLQKFDHAISENYVLNYHPESVLHNYDEIAAMTKVTRNADGIIIDKLHRTIPYLTKYEKARILGQRAKQINSGAYPLVKVPENVIDGLIIAELELKQKRIPFIIRRPLPNGGSEYWKVKDLEDISF